MDEEHLRTSEIMYKISNGYQITATEYAFVIAQGFNVKIRSTVQGDLEAPL